MFNYQLIIHSAAPPEMMERILRVVRHRGFCVRAINMVTLQDNQLKIKLTVEGERPLELLVNQLNKLLYIFQIEIVSNTAQG